MSTVAPSKAPPPISRWRVAERRSPAICHAALRTSAGNTACKVWARASSKRSEVPAAGSTGGGAPAGPHRLANCRAMGSRTRSSSRVPRSPASGSSPSNGPEEDSRSLHSLCASIPGVLSFIPQGCCSWSDSPWVEPRRRNEANGGARRDAGMRCAPSRTMALLDEGSLITKDNRTVREMVAYKSTGGAK